MTDSPPPLNSSSRSFDKKAIRRALHRAALWSVFLLMVISALLGGLKLRRYAWDQTEPFRYTTDINNAFRQGTSTLGQIGYLDRYDAREAERNENYVLDLDYGPGRLAIASLWSRWVHRQIDPPGTDPSLQWRREFYSVATRINRQYELCRPMLLINITGEILSAVAMFFLVRRYTAGEPPVVGSLRGTVLGLIAALVFWFNPALIWNAHCWPQWDSWVLPFFLWAMLLASLGWWFCAGVLIATGAMFKGQILFGAPVFVLWPLWQGRLPAIARWIVGLLTATAAITAIWLVRVPGTNPTGYQFILGHVNPASIVWVIYLAAVFAVMPSLLWYRHNPKARIPAVILVAAIISWLSFSTHAVIASVFAFVSLTALGMVINQRWSEWTWHIKVPVAWFSILLLLCPIWLLARDWMFAVVIAITALGILLMFAPRRVLPFAAAGWIATATLLSGFPLYKFESLPMFNDSHAWFDLGIAYGTHHYERMTSAENNNLASLLEEKWAWDDLLAPAFSIPRGKTADFVNSFSGIPPGQQADIALKYLLISVWLSAVIVCSIGTAIHDSRRSPQFLAAMAAPWILFFAVMTQMHQRYLLWGASLSAASAVLSPGLCRVAFVPVSGGHQPGNGRHVPQQQQSAGPQCGSNVYRELASRH